MLLGKIHRATITEADLHYEGSVSVDRDLLEAAGFLTYEQVQIYNVNNGERFETYFIEAEPGSGKVCLNGAAARRGSPGDLIIMAAYGWCDEVEAREIEPRVVLVDQNNRIVNKKGPGLRAAV